METDKLILVVSLAINVSLLLYFFQPLALVWFLKKQKRGRRTTEVICCYERRPNILRKLWVASSVDFLTLSWCNHYSPLLDNIIANHLQTRTLPGTRSRIILDGMFHWWFFMFKAWQQYKYCCTSGYPSTFLIAKSSTFMQTQLNQRNSVSRWGAVLIRQ